MLYRLLRLGAMPATVRRTLEREGMELFDEGVPGSLTCRNVSGPGKRWWRRREGFIGSLAVTRTRFIAYSFWRRQINVALDDAAFSALQIAMPQAGVLETAFDAGAVQPGWRGRMVLRFRTRQADQFMARLTSSRVL